MLNINHLRLPRWLPLLTNTVGQYEHVYFSVCFFCHYYRSHGNRIHFQRKTIAGSCGGLGALGIAKACDCPEPCDRKKARMEKEAIRTQKIKEWEKDKIL